MIKRKKGVVLIAALAAAVSLAACGEPGGSIGADAGTEGGSGQDAAQTDGQSAAGEENAGDDLDHIEPDPADDNWYMKGSIYVDSEGHRLEVFFDDEGMLEFAVDGLSLYYSSVDRVQFENNWRIYSCDDGTMIVYYPGEPAHIEISDGDHAGLYEEDAAQGDS